MGNPETNLDGLSAHHRSEAEKELETIAAKLADLKRELDPNCTLLPDDTPGTPDPDPVDRSGGP
jgi:hypothetical protein